jgi:hypothetical protein
MKKLYIFYWPITILNIIKMKNMNAPVYKHVPFLWSVIVIFFGKIF